MNDPDILNWLQAEQVDTIYLDDGRIIDVRSGKLRESICSAKQRFEEEPAGTEEYAS